MESSVRDSEFVRLWSNQKQIKQLEVEGARAPVPHSWRRHDDYYYYTLSNLQDTAIVNWTYFHLPSSPFNPFCNVIL